MTRFENLFIGIAGMIGAGKSTLATALGKHLDIDVHYEPVDNNEYLADFYRDTKRYSFATQIYLDLFRNMSNFMCKPNVISYLDVSPERSMERVILSDYRNHSFLREATRFDPTR